MRFASILCRAAFAAGVVLSLCPPAIAQDAFDSTADASPSASTQTSSTSAQAPELRCVMPESIGPQSATAVASTSTVRVNNLAVLERNLHLFGTSIRIIGLSWGGAFMIWGFFSRAACLEGTWKRTLWGATGFAIGLATPSFINWLIASARDGSTFS